MEPIVLIGPDGNAKSFGHAEVESAVKDGYKLPAAGVTMQGTVINDESQLVNRLRGGQTAAQSETVSDLSSQVLQQSWGSTTDAVSSGVQGLASGLTAGLVGKSDDVGASLQREYNPTANAVGEVTGMVGGAVIGSSLGGAKSALGGVAGISAELGAAAGEAVSKYGTVAKFATEGAVDALSYSVARETVGALVHDDPFSLEAIATETVLGGALGGGLGILSKAASGASKAAAKLDGVVTRGEKSIIQGAVDVTPDITQAQAKYAFDWGRNMRSQAEVMLEDAKRLGDADAIGHIKQGMKQLDGIEEVMVGGGKGSNYATFERRLSKLDNETSMKLEELAAGANDSLSHGSKQLDRYRLDPASPAGMRAKLLEDRGYTGTGAHAAPDVFHGISEVRYGDLMDMALKRSVRIKNATKTTAKLTGDITASDILERDLNKQLRDVPLKATSPKEQLDELMKASGRSGDVRIPVDLLKEAPEAQLHKLFGATDYEKGTKISGILSMSQLSDIQKQMEALVTRGKVTRFDIGTLPKSAEVAADSFSSGRKAISAPYDGGVAATASQTVDTVVDTIKPSGVKQELGALATTLMNNRIFRTAFGLHFGGIGGALLANPRAAKKIADAAVIAISKMPVRQAVRYSSSELLRALHSEQTHPDTHPVDRDVAAIHSVKSHPDAVPHALMDTLVNIRASSTKTADAVAHNVTASLAALSDILPKSNNNTPGTPDLLSPSQRFEGKEKIMAFQDPYGTLGRLPIASTHAVEAVKTCWPEVWFKFQTEVLKATADGGKVPDHIARWFPTSSYRFNPQYLAIGADMQAQSSLSQMQPRQQSAPKIDPGAMATTNQSRVQ